MKWEVGNKTPSESLKISLWRADDHSNSIPALHSQRENRSIEGKDRKEKFYEENPLSFLLGNNLRTEHLLFLGERFRDQRKATDF